MKAENPGRWNASYSTVWATLTESLRIALIVKPYTGLAIPGIAVGDPTGFLLWMIRSVVLTTG